MSNLDIIIPVYNAALHLPDLIDQLDEWVSKSDYDVHVIFVDDCSQDSSYSILVNQLNGKKFRHSVFQLAKNYGQHTATTVGFHFSTAPLIATMDDDLQHFPKELDKLLEKLHAEDLDLVFGEFENKLHAKGRNIGSNLLKRIMGLTKVDYSLVTSFRLMKDSVIQNFKQQLTPVIFVDEYLMRNAILVASCKVDHQKRQHGASSYSTFKLFKFAIQIIVYHSPLPLKLITRFGLFMAIVFFIIGCYYIYAKFAIGAELGFTSLIVAIFFSTGMIMLSLGIIGEYIRRIWIAQKNFDKVLIRAKK